MAKQAEKSKAEKVNRVQAAKRVVAEFKGKTTLAALGEKADALVVAGGRKSNLSDAASHAAKNRAILGIIWVPVPGVAWPPADGACDCGWRDGDAG